MAESHQISDSSTDAGLMEALRLIDGWIGPRGPSGVGAVVWHRDTIVAERYVGEAQPGVPVNRQTIFALASVTKPITATVVVRLVEAGYFSLDEPVVQLVPEFRMATALADAPLDPGLERLRASVTTRQLLCHTSGLPEDLGPRQSRYAEQIGLGELVETMCQLPLISPPGAQLRYSNVGYAVLTRLVERLTGEDFWAVARQLVLDPLQLNDTVANPGPELATRLVRLTDVSHEGTEVEAYNSRYWRQLAIPWGGLFGTPRDLAKFGASFLDSGPRLISRAARDLMTSDQAGVPGEVESAKVRWAVASWGLGWEIKGTKRRHWTGEFTSASTFCHFGHAGTLLWVDPTHQLALAVFANRTVTNIWSFLLARWARLSNALVAAATQPR